MNKESSSFVESALDFFSGFYKTDISKNSNIILNDEYIDMTVQKIIKLLPNLLEENIVEIKRKIKSQYAIYQLDGVAILADYEHFDNWYNNLDLLEEFFWDRYKRHLLDEGFSPNVVDKLEKDTLNNLMSYVGNPNADESFARKGLVVGDVQSGKTSNYIGLICKAADAGYKVIFLLTGTIESLRQQTQIRVEEGFIGYNTADEEDVGVGRGRIVPFAFTTRNKDFVKGAENNTALLIQQQSTIPYIFIIKKNVSVLKKIHAAIKRNLRGNDAKVKFPMLMIDDEADNASVNTNDEDNDPTQTNAQIRKILALFEKSNYVGFTATPFANVFIDPNTDDEMLENDLFPKDFIYALFPPSNYNGAKKMFVDKDENSDRFMLEFVDKNEKSIEEHRQLLPLNHKKDWTTSGLPSAVYEAVDRFLIVNAIRDLKDKKKNTHRSMLINMSRFKDVQFLIAGLIEDYVKNTKNDIKQSWKLAEKEYLKNESVARLYTLFNKGYIDCGFGWREIFNILLDSIKDIEIITVNSDKKAAKLNYNGNKNGCRVIVVGGMALSRGLTLEGLMISYFYRNSATFDVLMQMGRWFGYREDYKKLCKVYMLKSSSLYYKEIVESTEQLKRDMKRMHDRKQRPTEYGIRVRNDFYNNLRITAANKMRSTKHKVVHKDFWGEMFYTPFLNYGDGNIHNVNLTKELVDNNSNKQDKSISHIYLRDIKKEDILSFLGSLNMDADLNDNFDVKQLIGFIKGINLYFDILIMGGGQEEVSFGKSFNIKLQYRKYDLMKQTSFIRINKHRLGGNNDTSYGLNSKVVEKINLEYEGKNEKNYLVKERNPILIIYLIKPNNKLKIAALDDMDEDELIETRIALKDEVKKAEELQFEKEQASKEISYLIGYQIGFPRCDESTGESHRYVTNINADYYKLQASIFDDGEDI